MALYGDQWTCGHCGWANFVMRISCRNCAKRRGVPVAEPIQKRLPRVEHFTLHLGGKTYSGVGTSPRPRAMPWFARPKPKPDPALPAGPLRGVEPSDDPIADMAEWAKKL